MDLTSQILIDIFSFVVWNVDRENGVEDVTVKILYCGVCHSDLHAARNEWGFSLYPLVPGYDAYMQLFSRSS